MVSEEKKTQAASDVGMADEALAQSQTAIALKMATRAALADPTNRDASALVAWLHGSDGKPQHLAEAIAELTSSLDEDPRHVRTLLFRARLRKRSGKTQEAIADLQAALAVEPGHKEVEAELRTMGGKPT
jgi:tetratricopeptide (TPR) repeat protein